MRKQFVDALGWLEEQEMLDLTAIAQSSPGPIAVNAAILLGYRGSRRTGGNGDHAGHGHSAAGDSLGDFLFYDAFVPT